MGVFHVFVIVQMVPNRAKHLILKPTEQFSYNKKTKCPELNEEKRG